MKTSQEGEECWFNYATYSYVVAVEDQWFQTQVQPEEFPDFVTDNFETQGSMDLDQDEPWVQIAMVDYAGRT